MEAHTRSSKGNRKGMPTCMWRGAQAGSESLKNELQLARWMWGRGRKRDHNREKNKSIYKAWRCLAAARCRGQEVSVAGAWWFKGKLERWGWTRGWEADHRGLCVLGKGLWTQCRKLEKALWYFKQIYVLEKEHTGKWEKRETRSKVKTKGLNHAVGMWEWRGGALW